MTAIRVWNYNKNAEDTCRGVQLLHAFLDEKRVTPPSGVTLRRAPGRTPLSFDLSRRVCVVAKAGHAVCSKTCYLGGMRAFVVIFSQLFLCNKTAIP